LEEKSSEEEQENDQGMTTKSVLEGIHRDSNTLKNQRD